MSKLIKDFINLVAPLGVLAVILLAALNGIYLPILGLGIIVITLFNYLHHREIATVFELQAPAYPRYPLLIGACVTMIGVIIS